MLPSFFLKVLGGSAQKSQVAVHLVSETVSAGKSVLCLVLQMLVLARIVDLNTLTSYTHNYSAMTTSFGSICFGSLLVAFIQALQALANAARNEGDAGILACIAECILSCLASLVEYFNKWAFVYVGSYSYLCLSCSCLSSCPCKCVSKTHYDATSSTGLYGYPYLQAGKNVITLFQNRGWEAIIADDLVGNTLFLVSVIVGGLSGIVGLLLDVTTDYFQDTPGNTRLVAFLYVCLNSCLF